MTIPLMLWFNESKVNWTIVFIGFIFLQSTTNLGKLIIQNKMDIIKLASINIDKLELIK